MKALYFNSHGSIDCLQYGDISEPRTVEGEAVIQVKACALNHLDLWVLKGWKGLSLTFPHIGGADISGVIAEVNSHGTSKLKVGTRVVVNPGISTAEDEWTKRGEESLSPGYKIIGEHRRGGFAEYVSVPVKNLHLLPDHISFTDGAAPLLVGLTAWRMLKLRAQLKQGETVLVVGAGGGLNSLSIQLCKYFGARVFAIASSAEKAEMATALGADEVIVSQEYPDWDKQILKQTHFLGVDVVIDNVGQATFQKSLRAACRGGRIVTVGNTSGPTLVIDNRYIFSKQLSIIGSTMGSASDFEEVLKLIFSNTIKPVIARELPLKDGAEGYRLLKEGLQFGKIVLTPRM